MANFFDKLSANLTNESRKLSQKVKNSTDASRLMSEITAENKNIQENLNAIGKLYYDICKDSPDEAFREMVESIIKSEQRIAELQESIKIIRAREPELVPVPEETPFASPAENTKPSSMVCMGCGNTYTEGNVFCSVCGQKLVPQYRNSAAAAAAPAQTAEDVQTKPEEPAGFADADVIDAEIVEDKINLQKSDFNAETDAKFCPYCGKKMLDKDQAFCDNCGHAL
ncbi:MAG: zinc ribbon domain-containing protein [Oscillospiraceae bacterium]|nr:zinc ribbon domain-containing protein [Oscillospiraceae bacterium]